MDALSIVVDEVALEGLDGITLPSLWIRLEDREPKFPLKLDGCTKGFIWRSLVNNADLSFHELPEERDDIELFDRFKDIDPETGCETQKFSHDRRDVYPLHVIPENQDGIQGSCVFFKERKNITKQIRSKSFAPLVNLEEAQERYGRKLVVVASQDLRFRTLIGSNNDPESKISNDSYCVLERVGRGRWQGELQSDMHGSLFKIDARKMHYLRKCLVKHELVTMQSYVRRLKTGQQQHSILLLLKRFHVNRRNKYDILMEHVSDFLLQLPDHFTTVDSLKEHLNLNEKTLKRLFKSLRYSKLVEFCQCPLEDLDPSAEHCTNKNGSKVLIRCIKLLKPYGKKTPADSDDDDEDDDDYAEGGGGGRVLPSEGRIMERDFMSQAYHIILSSGTKGVPQREIGLRMNVGRLESRMICRKMDRDEVIKSFMEDEGRQRTTKFISHKCASASNQLQLFAKEQERNKLLSSSASHKSDTKTSATLSKSHKTPRTQKSKKAGGSRNKDEEEDQQVRVDHTEDEELNGKSGEADEKSGAKRTEEEDCVTRKQMEPDAPVTPSPQAESETPSCSGFNDATTPDSVSISAPEPPVEEEEQPNSPPASSLSQNEAVHPSDNPANAEVVEIDSIFQPQRSHETYRLLKRKNMIVEAIQSFQIIEGFFPLQKIINDAEKKDGVSSKCCKKTVLRLVHNLSREGLLKLYTTTVIQDGVTKKVDIIAHPSIQPSDVRVSQLIEQIRFRISSSYAAGRLQVAEEKGEQLKSEKATTSKAQKSISRNEMLGCDEDASFKPTPVPGLGKTLGFQPKMIRLRVVHSFLWYLIYGHPLRNNPTEALSASQSPAEPASSDSGAGLPESQAKQDEISNPPSIDEGLGDEDGLQGDQSEPDQSAGDMKVYADEDSWRRFIPPVPLHKGFTSGWAMVRSLLLCLPLSIFVQIVQINYKVDELEDYLSDSVKQHYLVRALPSRMKRQLLYKRKYIFLFHENLQKLTYMGLVQFGVVERFKDKDQVFVYLKHKASIVDTTTSEPHYWLVQEPPDSPFERRQYTFNTTEDVESFWFDLMCVCLNTPLGVVRGKRNNPDDDSAPPFVHDHNTIAGMSYLLKGSYEVCDDGSIPGDGRGAAGLDSELFSHLKRNWLWTCHLLTSKAGPSISEGPDSKLRLNSLSRNSLRMTLQAGKSLTPCYLTNKRPLIAENVEMGIESVLRNKRVVGGKGQTRKRKKTEVVKAPRRKKKEPRKRTRAHDATDHQALKRMTRHRVYWSVQEDSVMMLCSVASQLLNSKIKRPFVPYCVVRDLLHAEFDISKDKTSVAVGRRTRYILKNPQTLLNYRICLAEVHQDKALMSLLEKNKPADPDQADDCAKVFSEYVRLLRQKFSTVMCDHNLVIPDSQEQIFTRFKVSVIDSGKYVPSKDIINCTEDIHGIVLHNLIQSSLSMTNGQMKSFRSFQTFHTYSKYNQELLCQVFVQCKKRRMFNRRRISKTLEPKKNRGLPMLPMSFQMSQTYYRHFVWRFPFSLCTDSFCFLRNLITRGPGVDRPTTTFYHEPENRSLFGEEVCDRKKSKQAKHHSEAEPQMQIAGAESTVKVDNNQSLIREEKKSREPEEKLENTVEKIQSDEKKDPSGDDDASSSREQTDESPDPPDLSDMLEFPLNSPGGACLVSLSLMTLGWLSVHVSVPKQIVVVDSSLVDNEVVKSMDALEEDDDNDDDDGDECDGRKKLQVSAHQASHTNYLLMRGYCSPGIVKLRNLNMNDNIVVESCILKLSLRDVPAHHIFGEQIALPLELTKSGPSLLPPILTRVILSPSYSPPTAEECDEHLVQDRRYSAQDIEACARLRRSLDEAGEKGLDERDLHISHLHLQEAQSGRTRSLQQYLKDLQDEGQVVRVGSQSVRWVLMEHAEPWLLTVSCKQMSQPHENANRRPHLTSQYNIPFARKRCIKAMQLEAEGPPAKKPASDKEKQTGGDTGAVGPGKPSEDDGPGKPSEDDGSGKPSEDDGSGKPSEDDGSGKPSEDDGPGKPSEDDGPGKPSEDDGSGKPSEDDGPGKPNEDDGSGKPNEDDGSGKPNEAKQQKERTDDGSGDKTLILETGKEVLKQPEQEGEERMETEQEQCRPRRIRKCRLSGEKVEEAVESPSVDTEQNVSFISRPWRFIDGKVNRPVCKAILEAVLYHIMSQPGLTQQTLLEHYKDALQPVTVLDIVQALTELGCITKRTLVKDPKPSLFSSSAPASRGSTAAIEEPDTVFYEPTISCCLRLCRVLPNERHWNNNLP